MFDVLTERLGKYFRHEDPDHEVLELDDRAIACRNVRRAVQYLDIDVDNAPSDELLFDPTLEAAVKRLQQDLHHSVKDGTVGPATRRLIVWTLLLRFGPSIFARLKRPHAHRSIFLSYAHADKEQADALHAWLEKEENLDVHVIQDTGVFRAGASVSDNIRSAVAKADKVIVIWSSNSHQRDWVALERAFAEEVERALESSLLIYLCVDDTPLPEHDKTRVAIRGAGKTLNQIKDDLLRALERRGP